MSNLRDYLKMLAEMQRNFAAPAGTDFKYFSIEEFVLMNGRTMLASLADPRIKRGRKKECFKNSTLFALYSGEDCQYVEGYVLKASLPIPIHHAWILDEHEYVVDPTLGWEPDAEYFGVAFPTQEVARRVVKNGFYGLFSDGIRITDLVLGLDDTFRYRDPQASTLTLEGDSHEPAMQSQGR